MLHSEDTQNINIRARNTETRPISSKSNVKNDLHATLKMCKSETRLQREKLMFECCETLEGNAVVLWEIVEGTEGKIWSWRCSEVDEVIDVLEHRCI
jgi:hypothetical protein